MSLKTVAEVGKRLCETSLLMLAGIHSSWNIHVGMDYRNGYRVADT